MLYLPMRNAHFTQQQFRAFEEGARDTQKRTGAGKSRRGNEQIRRANSTSASQIVFYYKNGAFYAKTSNIESKLAEVRLSLNEPLFRIVTTSSPPP
ncbi:hypothetical protein AS159_08980 [Thermotoga sp. Ku-13t]|nr:hypothetical protein AS159_08980 [Thermotoga sp. Ku-13t]